MTEPKNEHQLQAICFLHHWNTYPEFRSLLFHVNNKAKNAREGNKMKSLGVVKGVPDFVYLFKSVMYGIEFKFEEGVLSADQKKVHDQWTNHQAKIYVCRSFDQFLEIIKEIHSGDDGRR